MEGPEVMSVAKQPAVYTHTCDRCKDTHATDDGNATKDGWTELSKKTRGDVAAFAIGDLCAGCSEDLARFMLGKAASAVVTP
jgi:hypothetical protein